MIQFGCTPWPFHQMFFRSVSLSPAKAAFFPEASDAYRHVFDAGQKLRALIDDSYYKKVDEAVRLMANELNKPDAPAPWEKFQPQFSSKSKTGNQGN